MGVNFYPSAPPSIFTGVEGLILRSFLIDKKLILSYNSVFDLKLTIGGNTMAKKSKDSKKDYSSVGDIGVKYSVTNPEDIEKCHSTFEEFCEIVDLVGHTHSPHAVQLSIDKEGRVVIEWLVGGPMPIMGYTSEIPVFTHWHPVSFESDGTTIDRYGELSGKLPSEATFTLPLSC